MAKYTEEELLEIKDQAYVPKPEILEAFNKLVDSVRLDKKTLGRGNGDTYIDEKGNERPYSHMNRRRASRTGQKPNLRKKAADVTVDEDGWATFTKPKKSFSAEDGKADRDEFREAAQAIKIKPNNKNLGSSKAVDPRDTIADKQTIAFNAFAALESEDDSE